MCGGMAAQPTINATLWGGISATPQTKPVTETETHPAKGAEVSECLKLLFFFFHVGETEVCREAWTFLLGELVITVGVCHWAETPPDSSQEGNGMGASHRNSNICPPGTQIWGRVFQQITPTGTVWAASSVNGEPSKMFISLLQFDSTIMCDSWCLIFPQTLGFHPCKWTWCSDSLPAVQF